MWLVKTKVIEAKIVVNGIDDAQTGPIATGLRGASDYPRSCSSSGLNFEFLGLAFEERDRSSNSSAPSAALDFPASCST